MLTANISTIQALEILQHIHGFSSCEALTYFEKLANIKLIDDVLNDVEHMEIKYYLEQHPYDIYYSASDKRWRTYLPADKTGGKRKPITSVSKTNLEKKIVDFYKHLEHKPVTDTLETLYPLFLSYKEKETTLANANKINWVWTRYFKENYLAKQKFTNIKVPELKEWLLDKVEEFQLDNRHYKEMKSLLNMLFDYAVELDIIPCNTARNIKKISYKKFTKSVEKSPAQQIYQNGEMEQLIQTALTQYSKTKNTAYLAVCLSKHLATRVGELVALKSNDFTDSTVHIQRQEIKAYTKNTDGTICRNGYDISPYTKSKDSDRILPLTPMAKYFFTMIQNANMERGFYSEYLMLNANGNRMNEFSINNVLRKLNTKISTPQKGSHGLRKTCLSDMKYSGLLTDEEIRRFAGHKDIFTTLNCYIFPIASIEKRIDAYESAIDGNIANVFKSVQS